MGADSLTFFDRVPEKRSLRLGLNALIAWEREVGVDNNCPLCASRFRDSAEDALGNIAVALFKYYIIADMDARMQIIKTMAQTITIHTVA